MMQFKWSTYLKQIMERKYVPISCSFYDELEAIAVQKKTSLIQYLNENGEALEAIGTIKDLFIDNKVEYMLLDNDQRIRLDTLLSVNGKALKNYC